MEEKDITYIQDLLVRTGTPEFRPDGGPYLKKSLTDAWYADQGIVALEGHGIVGYCEIYPLKLEPGIFTIRHLAVEPAFQKQGVARELVTAVLDEGAVLRAYVRESITACLDFYRHLGFYETGYKSIRGIPTLVFEKSNIYLQSSLF